MPYVSRNPEGTVDSLHLQASEAASEWLDDQHPDVQGFLGMPGDDAGFSRLDADFVRVIEDLVDVLLSKNILNITDLPAEAQAKLFARKSFREKASKNSLQLFDADGGDII